MLKLLRKHQAQFFQGKQDAELPKNLFPPINELAKVTLIKGNGVESHAHIGHELFEHAWNTQKKHNLIPIYVSLNKVSTLSELPEKALREADIKENTIDTIKKTKKCLLIVDGYSSIKKLTNIWVSSKLYEWHDIKIIYVCELFIIQNHKDYQHFFKPITNEKTQPNALTEISINSPNLKPKITTKTKKQKRPKKEKKRKLTLMEELEKHPLNQRSYIGRDLINFWVDFLRRDDDDSKHTLYLYWRFIYASNNNERFAIGAANAITILNKAYTAFFGMNFPNPNIPGADLRGARLNNTNFVGGNLSYMQLSQATLIGTTFASCDMNEVNLGQRPYFKHPDVVTCTECSRDGSLLAIGGGGHPPYFGEGDFTINIWDIEKHKIIQSINAHKSPIKHLSFSADGRFLASSCEYTILIWAKVDQNYIELQTLQTPRDLAQIQFSNLDHTLVIMNQTQAWYLSFTEEGFKVTKTFRIGPEKTQLLFNSALSKNLSRLATTDDDMLKTTDIHIFSSNGNTDDHFEIKVSQLIESMQLNPDGNLLAVCIYAKNSSKKETVFGNVSRKILFWDLTTKKKIREIDVLDTSEVRCLAFDDNNKYIALGTKRGEVAVWEIQTGKKINIDCQVSRLVHTIKFSPDSHWLYVGGINNIVFQLNLEGLDSTPTPLINVSLSGLGINRNESTREIIVTKNKKEILKTTVLEVRRVFLHPFSNIVVTENAKGLFELRELKPHEEIYLFINPYQQKDGMQYHHSFQASTNNFCSISHGQYGAIARMMESKSSPLTVDAVDVSTANNLSPNNIALIAQANDGENFEPIPFKINHLFEKTAWENFWKKHVGLLQKIHVNKKLINAKANYDEHKKSRFIIGLTRAYSNLEEVIHIYAGLYGMTPAAKKFFETPKEHKKVFSEDGPAELLDIIFTYRPDLHNYFYPPDEEESSYTLANALDELGLLPLDHIEDHEKLIKIYELTSKIGEKIQIK